MQQDVYERGLVTASSFASKNPVLGRLVAILDAQASERALSLISPLSRAVLEGEIHELIVTTEDAAPGKSVNAVSYLAFFQVTTGGIILSGDTVDIDGQAIGRLAGYDLSHFPNHMNIVVRGLASTTGKERGLRLGQTIRFSGIPER